jgi:polyhydroxyalkanoate synthase
VQYDQEFVSRTITDMYYDKKDAMQIYSDYFRNMFDFVQRYNLAILEAAATAASSALNPPKNSIQEIQNMMRISFDSTLSKCLNEESFAASLGTTLDSWTEMIDLSGGFRFNRSISDFLSYLSRQFEPFRDSINRTPSEIIKINGGPDLLHYRSTARKKKKTPILVIYSLINRYYILDLMPGYSVIQNLLNQGFDIYATDWGTPSSYDKDLTLENYAEGYVGNALEEIKRMTGSEKVSLFGYCWGGIFALIYAATHPENVQALILHATPVDIKEGETIIENWTSHVNADRLVQICGNVPGWMLNLAFLLRNPLEAVLKYPRYFSQPRSLDETAQFFAIETWLYDSRPIVGEVYREIVNQIYKKNLLIRNKMRVAGKPVDLTNVKMPILNIVGEKDDLVPPRASRPIIDAVASKDKKSIEFPTGHVGLCISKEAHEKLWPEVGSWLAQRS